MADTSGVNGPATGGDENIDKVLKEINERVGEYSKDAKSASALRMAQELKRMAERHGNLYHYVWGNFQILNQQAACLEPFLGQDAGLRVLMLLENREQATKFEPNFDEDMYENLMWLIVPTYHLYACCMGSIHGFNSRGLQQCISDGMEVCRRTSSPFITSFRELAIDVYLAADDFDMAIHHAQTCMNTQLAWQDRRWPGAEKSITAWLAAGHLNQAMQVYEASRGMAETWYCPGRAKRESAHLLKTTLAMMGKSDEFARHYPAGETDYIVAPGEDLRIEFEEAMAEAVVAACGGDFESAIEALEPQDRALNERKHLEMWFEGRTRLVGLYLLKGDRTRASRLAKPLGEKAQEARDYRTISRLAYMFLPGAKVSPLAGSGPVQSGPWAPVEAISMFTPGRTSEGGNANAGSEAPQEAPATSLGNVGDEGEPDEVIIQLKALVDSVPEGDNYPARVSMALIKFPEEQLTTRAHVVAVLTAMSALSAEGQGMDVPGVWAWAKRLSARFAKEPEVLSQVADLGRRLMDDAAGAEAPGLSKEELEGMLRSALLLGQNNGNVFFRAGLFWFGVGDYSEAEHCLARAFRLDRSNPQAAKVLSHVYRATGQPADALAVLEMCIREKGGDLEILTMAAAFAMEQERWQLAHTYIVKVMEMEPGLERMEYLLGVTLLALGRHAEALEHVEAEKGMLSEEVLRDSVRAAALAGMGRMAQSRDALSRMISVDLRTLEEETLVRLKPAYERVWPAVAALPEGDPLGDAAMACVLGLGIAPSSAFEPLRRGGEAQELSYFMCLLEQPLDGRWQEHPACLGVRREWDSYRVMYGVLAVDEESATHMALAMQARCQPLGARVLGVESKERFEDRPGVVMQSDLFGPEAKEGGER
jgi:hypothetical protein